MKRYEKYSQLRGRMIEFYGGYGKCAEAIGINPQVLSRKLNGRTDFTRAEIEMLINALNIPHEAVWDYFFCGVS